MYGIQRNWSYRVRLTCTNWAQKFTNAVCKCWELLPVGYILIVLCNHSTLTKFSNCGKFFSAKYWPFEVRLIRLHIFVHLDLSAAFNSTIDISTLLRRLRYSFGISGPALNWIASYVVGRTQFVRVGQEQSLRTDCEYRVQQGSVLRPLLFTLYMSPVAAVISSFGVDHAQYADDTQLYIALKKGSLSTLTECIRALHHWLDLNGLCLNPDKTEAVIVGTLSLIHIWRCRRRG